SVGRLGDPDPRRGDDVELERLARGDGAATTDVAGGGWGCASRELGIDGAVVLVHEDRARPARVRALQVAVGVVARQGDRDRRPERRAAVGRRGYEHVVLRLAAGEVVVQEVHGVLDRLRVLRAVRVQLTVLVGELCR